MSIESNICDAVELLIDKAISKAEYDKTIYGIIKKCVDPALGKYLIKYQDSEFYAYSTNSTLYDNNTGVYILIPKNDMSKDKIIISAERRKSAIKKTKNLEKIDINLIQLINFINLYIQLKDEKLPFKLGSILLENNKILEKELDSFIQNHTENDIELEKQIISIELKRIPASLLEECNFTFAQIETLSLLIEKES